MTLTLDDIRKAHRHTGGNIVLISHEAYAKLFGSTKSEGMTVNGIAVVVMGTQGLSGDDIIVAKTVWKR